VPQGAERLPPLLAVLLVGLGGGLFALIDARLAKSGTPRSQLIAMLADFVPEAVALGALFAKGGGSGPLLALLIALQNLPEGFNAFREARANGARPGRLILAFSLLALIGPAAAFAGHAFFTDAPGLLGALMLVAAGGILYLIFQDIAPQTPLERAWSPPLGAVAGFMIGLAGHLYIP
jgi:ZIP family zinc transporter